MREGEKEKENKGKTGAERERRVSRGKGKWRGGRKREWEMWSESGGSNKAQPTVLK